jgi:hypothetical protein
MISQRPREARIVAKLHAGLLLPASAIQAVAVVRAAPESQPIATPRGCCGCDELGADTLVGDQPWHHPCYLFWQRRSEDGRDGPAPNAWDSRVTPDRARWVIVVRPDCPAVLTRFQRDFAQSAWVDVVVDRRTATPGDGGPAPTEDRRGAIAASSDGMAGPLPPFRRVYRGVDFAIYEATMPLPCRCSECDLQVTVELPRFADPPVHLEVTVLHEAVPAGQPRHVVEVQSFSPTGRVLLASRLRARPLLAA